MRSNTARRVLGLAAAAVVTALAAPALGQIRINEININPPGTDQGREYAEFISLSGGVESLAGMWFIGIDGDGVNTGVIDFAKNLSSFSTGTNGLFLLRDTDAVLNPPPAAATTVGIDDWVPDIENGSQTFLLVTGFTGFVGLDLDVDNDGLLDDLTTLPWTSIIDGVGFYEESLPGQDDEFAYAAQLGFPEFPNPVPPTDDPDIGFTPDILFRTSAGLWIGSDLLSIDPSLPLVYDSGQVYPVTTTDVGDVIDLRGLSPQTWTPGTVNPTLSTVTDTWIAGAGDWSNPFNWSDSIVPNGFNVEAMFPAGAEGAGVTINLDVDITLDRLRFAGGSYAINSPGGKTLRFSGLSEETIVVNAGSHSISSTVKFAKSGTVNVASSASLVIGGELSFDSSYGLTKTGGGTLEVRNVRAASLAVNDGKVRIAPDASPSGASVVNQLSVAGTGQLDLTDNGVVVDYDGVSPAGAIRSAILSGRAGGSWSGPGITSSTAAGSASSHAVGYAEAGELGIGTFFGQPVDASSVLIRYTRIGDANLDGTTGIGDFSLLAANFNQPADWARGDFDYDGQAGIGDFALLAANFNQSAGVAARGSAVPEPAALGALSLGGAALFRRRRA